MANIFRKVAEHFDLIPPQYDRNDPQNYREFQDGFATGYPLVGQPEYPAHNSVPYQYGLRSGRKLFKQAGCPQIQYEESGEE